MLFHGQLPNRYLHIICEYECIIIPQIEFAKLEGVTSSQLWTIFAVWLQQLILQLISPYHHLKSIFLFNNTNRSKKSELFLSSVRERPVPESTQYVLSPSSRRVVSTAYYIEVSPCDNSCHLCNSLWNLNLARQTVANDISNRSMENSLAVYIPFKEPGDCWYSKLMWSVTQRDFTTPQIIQVEQLSPHNGL